MGSKNAIRIVQSPHNFNFFVCQKVSPFCHWQKSRYHKNVLNKGYFERFLHHFWYTSELRCVIRFFSSPFNPFFFVFFNGFYAFQLEIILIKDLIIESAGPSCRLHFIVVTIYCPFLIVCQSSILVFLHSSPPSCLLQSLTGELRLINLARKLFYGVKRVVKFKTECKNHFLSKFFHENLGHCGLLKLLRYGQR